MYLRIPEDNILPYQTPRKLCTPALAWLMTGTSDRDAVTYVQLADMELRVTKRDLPRHEDKMDTHATCTTRAIQRKSITYRLSITIRLQLSSCISRPWMQGLRNLSLHVSDLTATSRVVQAIHICPLIRHRTWTSNTHKGLQRATYKYVTGSMN